MEYSGPREYSWYIHEIFMKYLVPTEYFWNTYGIPMYPRYLDDLWIYHVAFAILSNPPLPSRGTYMYLTLLTTLGPIVSPR